MDLPFEIRQRRLFQILAFYLATGWVSLEVVIRLVERQVLPEVVYSVALIGVLCGIPAALLVGWRHGERGRQRASRLELALLGLTGIVFLVLSSFPVAEYRSSRIALEAAERDAGANLRNIAVLYLRDHSPEGANQHLADGLTESLIEELSRVSGLHVLTRNASAAFRHTDASRDSVGRALGVGTLVDGIVEPSGERLRITLRLLDGYSGSQFRSATLDAGVDEVLEARDRLVEDAARMLRSWLGEEVRIRRGGQRVTDDAAWTLYQRAEAARKAADVAVSHDDVPGALRSWATADSLAARVEVLAPEWPEPVVLRAATAYGMSRASHEQGRILEQADEAVRHAERALAMAPNHARALELRGTATYWRYIHTRGARPEAAAPLLDRARADLEAAVRIDPLLASAHSTLSHLLYREDIGSAVLAARRAFEADAYLDLAPDILARLVAGNYDMENFLQLAHWCDEGGRRFPGDYRFTECRLLLLTTRHAEPDVGRAWDLLARLDSLAPVRSARYRRALGLMLVGGTIARASRIAADPAPLADSARATLARARSLMTEEVDPRRKLLPQTAYMYTLLGEEEVALELLRGYATANPDFSLEHHWWWRELRGAPGFQPLLESH